MNKHPYLRTAGLCFWCAGLVLSAADGDPTPSRAAAVPAVPLRPALRAADARPPAPAEEKKPGSEAVKADGAGTAPKEAAKDAPGKGAPAEAPKEAPKEVPKEPPPAAKGEQAKGTPPRAGEGAPAEVLEALKGADPEVEKAVKAALEKAQAGGAVEVKLDGEPAAQAAEASSGATPARSAAQKKPPEPPMFRLRDGTRLAGSPDLKAINVKTAYGDLEIPVAEVLRVRFAESEDTGIAARVTEQIKALSSEEFDQREEAMAALREIGAPALEALRKAAESEDEEVKSRAEKLVAEIEEGAEESEEADATLRGEDEVVTSRFTVRGKIVESKFNLTTRYGALTLGRNDIVSVVFQEPANTKNRFTVPGDTFAAANKWVDTKITLTQGQKIHLTATGQINLSNYGQQTGPEGTTNIGGNQLEGHPAGALVAKIGKGKAFLVGAEYEGSASDSGTLQLGISLQNGQISGQYEVELEREGDGP